ncbi:MAG: hypothetical protein A2007_05995 [Verrucomicrobia bacterium GWC2_42_7]|nr:MAG: hypothetical protein A2007_05995 [Verrucomicrobia bacterium GWC2_42_7]
MVTTEKYMNSEEVKFLLKENIRKENLKYFGFTDDVLISQVTNNWFKDNENYDGRWKLIRNKAPKIGKILDMAAGCGTFVLNGLQNGYDVYGVEPENWKREYFKKKIFISGYPCQWNNRIIGAIGETLPFRDESFDLITTYQTLEHVRNVDSCIKEMLRVLKHGGVLYIKAPDYNCFFEPHYRVPFLPKMNKKLAARYLKFIGRPVLGLKTLNWTTEKDVINILNKSKHKLTINRVSQFNNENRKLKINEWLPRHLKYHGIVILINLACEFKIHVLRFFMIGRREKNIDLWVTKG